MIIISPKSGGRVKLLKDQNNRYYLNDRKILKNLQKINILNLHIDYFKNKNKLKYNFAFSLIELSIVLIIIGLLVAGITGGNSLIKSAKQRAFINELKNWKQATISFYAAKGRLPGDLNNLGKIGRDSGQVYSSSSFPAPYNTYTPSVYSAPFIDLYLEGITDFKPTLGNNNAGYGYPYSKIYKNSYYYFMNYTSIGPSNYYTNAIKINSPYIFLHIVQLDRANVALDLKSVDQKIDDGLYNNGAIRAECWISSKSWYASYDEVIEDSNKTQYDIYISYRHLIFS